MGMKERVRVAAKRYLELNGCHVIYVDFLDQFIVAEDDDGLAFIDVFYTTDGMSTNISIAKRDVFEDAIHKFFLQEHEPIDVPIRYDIVELFICGDDRAWVKHYVNIELED